MAFNDTDTLNIDIGAGQTLELTDLTGDSLDTVVMTGATFTMGAGGGFHGDTTQDDLVVNASAMTGVVTYRFDNVDGGATSLTTGAGADIIEITNAHKWSYNHTNDINLEQVTILLMQLHQTMLLLMVELELIHSLWVL